MAWQRGQRRHATDGQRFIRCLLSEFSATELARLCGVDGRTIRRWRDGIDWPAAETLHRLVDSLCPQSVGSLPIYSPEMAIDGRTRVGGVGEFTVRAACGDQSYLSEMMTDDQESEC
jgi:hypothetical protein